MCTFIDWHMSYYEDLFDIFIVFEYFLILQGNIESLVKG